MRAPSAADTAGRALSARAFRRRNFFLARTAYLPTAADVFGEILGEDLLIQEILWMWENMPVLHVFYQGFPGYLNWFRRFLPPLAWFGKWWDQHKMSKTSILQFHSLSDFTGDSPWTQTSSSFLISGKNIISQFPSYLCFTFLS